MNFKQAATLCARYSWRKGSEAHAAVRVTSDADGRVTLRSMDLETYVTARPTGCTAAHQLDIAVDAALLRDAMKAAPAGDVVLREERNGDALAVGAVVLPKTVALDELPEPRTNLELDECEVVTVRELRQLVNTSAPCAATEKARFALNGIRFVLGGGDVEVCATDGRRAILTDGYEDRDDHKEAATVPVAGARAAVAPGVPATDAVTVGIYGGGSVVRFESPGLNVVTRAVDGVFPPIRGSVCPKGNEPTLFVADAARLHEALKVAKVYKPDYLVVRGAGEFEARVRVGLWPCKDSKFVGAVSAPDARGNFEPFGIDPKFLADALPKTGRVTLTGGPKSPVFIHRDDGFLGIVMPVNL